MARGCEVSHRTSYCTKTQLFVNTCRPLPLFQGGSQLVPFLLYSYSVFSVARCHAAYNSHHITRMRTPTLRKLLKARSTLNTLRIRPVLMNWRPAEIEQGKMDYKTTTMPAMCSTPCTKTRRSKGLATGFPLRHSSKDNRLTPTRARDRDMAGARATRIANHLPSPTSERKTRKKSNTFHPIRQKLQKP